jgi:hypothetical protein
MSLVGILHGLPRMFLAGLVVFFSMMNSGGPVRVRGHLMKFCGALMGIVRHDNPFYHTSQAVGMLLDAGIF